MAVEQKRCGNAPHKREICIDPAEQEGNNDDQGHSHIDVKNSFADLQNGFRGMKHIFLHRCEFLISHAKASLLKHRAYDEAGNIQDDKTDNLCDDQCLPDIVGLNAFHACGCACQSGCPGKHVDCTGNKTYIENKECRRQLHLLEKRKHCGNCDQPCRCAGSVEVRDRCEEAGHEQDDADAVADILECSCDDRVEHSGITEDIEEYDREGEQRYSIQNLVCTCGYIALECFDDQLHTHSGRLFFSRRNQISCEAQNKGCNGRQNDQNRRKCYLTPDDQDYHSNDKYKAHCC